MNKNRSSSQKNVKCFFSSLSLSLSLFAGIWPLHPYIDFAYRATYLKMTPWRIPLGGMRWSRLFRNKPSRNFLWTLNPMNRGRFSACFDRAQARARNQRAQWILPLLSSRWSSGWGPSKELRNYGVKIISAQRAANVRPFVPRHSDWLSQSRFAESEKNPIENSSQLSFSKDSKWLEKNWSRLVFLFLFKYWVRFPLFRNKPFWHSM